MKAAVRQSWKMSFGEDLQLHCVFLKVTKVLLYLTHLPLTDINNQYLIFLIGLGNFVSEKVISQLSTYYTSKNSPQANNGYKILKINFC